MSLRLSAAERLFYFDLLSQLTPDARAFFEARVAELLLVIADPGEGDVDRAVRAAFEACGWVPPPDGVERTAPCWTRKLRPSSRSGEAEDGRTSSPGSPQVGTADADAGRPPLRALARPDLEHRTRRILNQGCDAREAS